MESKKKYSLLLVGLALAIAVAAVVARLRQGAQMDRRTAEMQGQALRLAQESERLGDELERYIQQTEALKGQIETLQNRIKELETQGARMAKNLRGTKGEAEKAEAGRAAFEERIKQLEALLQEEQKSRALAQEQLGRVRRELEWIKKSAPKRDYYCYLSDGSQSLTSDVLADAARSEVGKHRLGTSKIMESVSTYEALRLCNEALEQSPCFESGTCMACIWPKICSTIWTARSTVCIRLLRISPWQAALPGNRSP